MRMCRSSSSTCRFGLFVFNSAVCSAFGFTLHLLMQITLVFLTFRCPWFGWWFYTCSFTCDAHVFIHLHTVYILFCQLSILVFGCDEHPVYLTCTEDYNLFLLNVSHDLLMFLFEVQMKPSVSHSKCVKIRTNMTWSCFTPSQLFSSSFLSPLFGSLCSWILSLTCPLLQPHVGCFFLLRLSVWFNTCVN